MITRLVLVYMVCMISILYGVMLLDGEGRLTLFEIIRHLPG